MFRRALLALSALALAALSACTEPPPPPKVEPKKPEAPKKTEPPKPSSAAAVTAVSGRSDPECLGPIDTAVPRSVTIGARTLEVNGYLAKVTSAADADDTATLGVLANVNEASGENLVNLGKYLAFFKENGVELILVAGDSGDDEAAISAVVKAIADAGLPTLVISGNREAKNDYVDSMNALEKDKPNVLNGNRVRHLDWDDVDVVTLPGYHDPRYIHAESNGCQYFKEDVEKLGKLAGGLAGDPKLLLAHGGPNGTLPTALDVIADKSNVGDPAINALLTDGKLSFGVFPNIKESGGRAVADIAQLKPLAEGTLSDALYLNPGSADSLGWTMNDGSTAQGMATVITVKGKQASYKLFKAPALSEADKAAAAKLAPPAPAPAPEAK